MADFRPCLIFTSYSQANLYHCIPTTIYNDFEFTIAHLRYFLGGHRPSETTYHKLSIYFYVKH
jgi:hypothetical protein